MEYQKFLEKYAKCYRLHFDFSAYYRAKKAAGATGKAKDVKTDEPVPTPNQIVRAFAKKPTCDTAVKSHLNGNVQELLIASVQQFLELLSPDQIAQRGAGGTDPNSLRKEIANGRDYIEFAQKCGLL